MRMFYCPQLLKVEKEQQLGVFIFYEIGRLIHRHTTSWSFFLTDQFVKNSGIDYVGGKVHTFNVFLLHN